MQTGDDDCPWKHAGPCNQRFRCVEGKGEEPPFGDESGSTWRSNVWVEVEVQMSKRRPGILLRATQHWVKEGESAMPRLEKCTHGVPLDCRVQEPMVPAIRRRSLFSGPDTWGNQKSTRWTTYTSEYRGGRLSLACPASLPV